MVNLSPSQQTQIQDLCHKHSFEQNSLLEKLQGLQAKLTTAVKVLDEVLQGTNFRFNPATARARAGRSLLKVYPPLHTNAPNVPASIIHIPLQAFRLR